MRHHHHGAALLGERAHHLEHLADELGVERRGGLVEQQHRRLHRQRARDRHALLLAARHVRRVGVAELPHPHALEVALGALARLGLRQPEHMHRRLDDVLEHRHVAPQVEVLEHHRQARADLLQLVRVLDHQLALAVAHQRHLLARHQDAACGRAFEEVDAAQPGALARAGRADDADHVARVRGQRDALEHLVVAVGFVQVFDADLFDAGLVVHVVLLRGRPRGARHVAAGCCSAPPQVGGARSAVLAAGLIRTTCPPPPCAVPGGPASAARRA
ncbi:proline/glycine betaine ABC transporter periplasmic protein [Thauera phenylacetica B4P]|uniref:Proline/glycine betaine ABC transporter periplasmic protein n=1 Tax=Thauera phenylacetica B4P TaxID=1234382 RepID=N6YR38_9RHOO|nr:proline/glycine betaine ABC transporter periplasmic protein [Thauera phenylacetica B4P]